MIRLHLVCSSDRVTEADAVLSEVWGSDQSGSFSVPLSPSGALPATHFGCSGVYEPSQAASIGAISWLNSATGDTSFDAFVSSLALVVIE